ncbi:MAG: hypothetical protein AAF985_07250 [Bacteroidota bacterium]
MLFLSLPFLLEGQSLAEKIGGVATNFRIKSDSIVLNDSQQLLIKRGVFDYGIDNSEVPEESYGYAYGYGYQSYHLEFTSPHKISTIVKSKKRRRSAHYIISLTDGAGRVYQNIKIRPSEVKSFFAVRGKDIIYAYSINLVDVPLIILNDMSVFNIVRIVG